MKIITGRLNFLLQAYSFQDFLNDMDKHNCQVLDVKRSFTSYIVSVKGKDSDLDHARWYFRNCNSII